MRCVPLALALLFATTAGAQTFRPLGGPWTRDHRIVGTDPVGSGPVVRIFAVGGSGLSETTSGGQFWSVLSETDTPRAVVVDGPALLGAFADGVRRSADGGRSWQPSGLDGLDVRTVASGSGADYAATEGRLYRRLDGADWLALDLPGGLPGNAELSFLVASGAVVAVSAGNLPNCYGTETSPFLARSLDAGATWTVVTQSRVPTGLAVAPDGTVWSATARAEYCSGLDLAGNLTRLAPSQSEPVIVVWGDIGGVALAPDGTAIYSNEGALVRGSQPIPLVNGPAALGAVAYAGAASPMALVVESRDVSECDPDPPCFYVSSSGLYALSFDRLHSTGFEPSRVRALAVIGDTLVAAADGAVFGSPAASGGWRNVAGLGEARGFVRVPWEANGLVAFSPGPAAPPYVSHGAGTSPSSLFVGRPNGYGAPLDGLATVSVVVVGDQIVSASSGLYAGSGVFVSGSTGETRRTLESADIGSVGAIGGTVYAGATDSLWFDAWGAPVPSARIFRSDDAGERWTPDDAGMTARNVFAFAGVAGLHVAGTSDGVFVRTPGGPWQADGLAERTVYTLYEAPAGLLAGTDDGLFLRTPDGTWVPFGDGLDGRTVYAVLATDDGYGPWLGVGTDAGVFATRPFGITADEPAPAAAGPLAVSILPNPARGQRTIHIDGLGAEPADIAAYDLLGRLVADLGAHTADGRRLGVVWDASRLPAGAYVVRVRTAREVATARAVVTR